MEVLWFYSNGNERKGPVPEAGLLALHAAGTIKDDDLVWTEGMDDWIPFGKSSLAAPTQTTTTPPPPPVPAAMAQTSPVALPVTTPPPAVPGLVPLPQGMAGWMKFNGVMFIIQGAFYCLNCIGAILGVPLIMAGIGLYGGADSLTQSGGISPGMVPFFQKFKTFNTAMGVFNIITLAAAVIAIFIIIIFFGAFISMLSTLDPSGMTKF